MARRGSRKTVKSFRGLNDELFLILRQAAIDAKPEILDELKRLVDKYLYNMNKPAEYERTYAFREKLEISIETDMTSKGRIVRVQRFYPTGSFPFNPEKNQHGSSQSIEREEGGIGRFISIIEEGTSGKKFGDGFWREPRPFVQAAIEELERTGKIQEIIKKYI